MPKDKVGLALSINTVPVPTSHKGHLRIKTHYCTLSPDEFVYLKFMRSNCEMVLLRLRVTEPNDYLTSRALFENLASDAVNSTNICPRVT